MLNMDNRKISQVKIKRPRNAFIIYRQEKSANVNYQLTSIFKVSKILGDQWKNESESVREYYRNKAKYESDMHKKKYPDYVFRRRMSSTISRRFKKNTDLESLEFRKGQLYLVPLDNAGTPLTQSFQNTPLLESFQFGTIQLLDSFESILESSMFLF
jgi:hypothetical protein